jgi:hypothetical protein
MFCDECAIKKLDGLIRLGFSEHRHGGMCMLEAPCVPNPYDNCPTPIETG